MPDCVRIFLEPLKRLPDEELDKWCIDAMIVKEKIIGRWFLHGTRSYDDTGWLTPFICHVDGRVDFGHGYEDRFYHTNIRERTIRIGSTVSLWDEHEKEEVYRIARIHRLTA
jgi:hypothetical protein